PDEPMAPAMPILVPEHHHCEITHAHGDRVGLDGRLRLRDALRMKVFERCDSHPAHQGLRKLRWPIVMRCGTNPYLGELRRALLPEELAVVRRRNRVRIPSRVG